MLVQRSSPIPHPRDTKMRSVKPFLWSLILQCGFWWQHTAAPLLCSPSHYGSNRPVCKVEHFLTGARGTNVSQLTGLLSCHATITFPPILPPICEFVFGPLTIQWDHVMKRKLTIERCAFCKGDLWGASFFDLRGFFHHILKCCTWTAGRKLNWRLRYSCFGS